VTSRTLDAASGHLLRELAPRVLGAVIRRFRDFAAAEDAFRSIARGGDSMAAGRPPENPRAC